MALFVDDETRTGSSRGLVAEDAGDLGFGGDVDYALVRRGIDQDILPLVRVEVLENIGPAERELGRLSICGGDETRVGETD